MCKTADPAMVGRRLREARLGRGLTQGQLADGLASTAQISRIESGNRRADPALLEHLAHRLDIPILELITSEYASQRLENEYQVDMAELLLASGDADGALRHCDQWTETGPSSVLSPDLHRRISRIRAGAHEALGDLPAAITAITTSIQRCPRDLLWIKDLIALSRCYRESGDPAHAITVAQEAAGEIARVGLEGTTEAIQLTVTTASAYAELGDVTTAFRLCQDAMAKADEIDSPLARASAYWNASVFESRQGRHESALPLAKSALIEFELAEEARNFGRLRLLVGELLLRLDPPQIEEAADTLARARRELEWSSAGVIEVARCDLFTARTRFFEGDWDGAQELIESALEIVGSRAPMPHAYALVLTGEIAFARGDRATARLRYQEAAQVLTGMGSDRFAGEQWMALAARFESVGDTESALNAYRSAAASAGLVAREPHQPRPMCPPADSKHRRHDNG